MRDEEERSVRRDLDAGGVEERAAFLSGLVSAERPCKACGGAGQAACRHDEGSVRACTPCLGTGLAMDESRLKLAAWLGDGAASLAASCGWCGGAKIVDNRPLAVNATSSAATLVYPSRNRPPASSADGRVTIVKTWPEYLPCRWCARPEYWYSATFADALEVRARLVVGAPEVVDVMAVGACLGLLRDVGHVGLPEAWEAMMDWTICPCRPLARVVHGHLSDFRDALRVCADPPGHVLAVADAMALVGGEKEHPFDPLGKAASRGLADDGTVISVACRSLIGMCMGATWD